MFANNISKFSQQYLAKIILPVYTLFKMRSTLGGKQFLFATVRWCHFCVSYPVGSPMRRNRLPRYDLILNRVYYFNFKYISYNLVVLFFGNNLTKLSKVHPLHQLVRTMPVVPTFHHYRALIRVNNKPEVTKEVSKPYMFCPMASRVSWSKLLASIL